MDHEICCTAISLTCHNQVGSGVQFEHQLDHTRCVTIAQHTVVVAGGWSSNNYLDAMYIVSLSATGAIIKRKYQMPAPLRWPGCVSVNGFILIFGGDTTGQKGTDLIYVFDIERCEWRRANIRCPQNGCFHAVLMGDNAHLFHIHQQQGNGSHSALSVTAILNDQVCYTAYTSHLIVILIS